MKSNRWLNIGFLIGIAVVLMGALSPEWRTVSVNTDGSVRGPTNLWDANQILKGRRFATLKLALEASLGTAKTSIRIDGLNTLNDGFQGWFTYDPTATSATNRGIVFIPTNGVGRIIRDPGRHISPKQFGAIGDGVADDTASVQAALNYCLSSGLPFISDPGVFRTTDTLTVSNGFAAPIDFGGFNPEQAAGTKSAVWYLDQTNKHFLTMLDPTRIPLRNLGLYIKPQNGWQSDYDSQPQQNDNAYAIRVVGWGTFLTLENLHALYGSGLIKNDFDTNLVSRAEARLFNNSGRNLMTRYGRYALDLVAGSGSSWDNLYFMTSSGGYTNQTAVSAIRIQEFANNETYKRLNVEWSSFTGPMLDLSSAELQFSDMHVEGVNLPYQGSSARWLIALNGGSFSLINSRFQDVRADWGFVTKQSWFYLGGGPRTRVNIEDSLFERVNENPDPTYRWVRYIDDAGGASEIRVSQLDDSDVGYWTNSPSWHGFYDGRLPSSKRFEGFTTFHAGNPWEVYYNGTPPALTYQAGSSNAVSFARLNTGTTEFQATVMKYPSVGIWPGAGVHRMKVRFRLSAFPTASTDDAIVRFGFFSNMSGAPQNTPSDGVYLQAWYGMGYSDDRVVLVTRAGGVESKTQLFPASYTAGGYWYEAEIIINNNRSQVRAYSNPRTTTYQANLTSNIPSETTELYPQIQVVKRGASPVTNFQIDVNYADIYSAPNGIY